MQNELQFQVHSQESNEESQMILQTNKKYFEGKCKILFEAFMEGKIINNNNSPVGDFRRRLLDLTKENGVRVSLISRNGALKNWGMTQEDMKYNLKFVKQ